MHACKFGYRRKIFSAASSLVHCIYLFVRRKTHICEGTRCEVFTRQAEISQVQYEGKLKHVWVFTTSLDYRIFMASCFYSYMIYIKGQNVDVHLHLLLCQLVHLIWNSFPTPGTTVTYQMNETQNLRPEVKARSTFVLLLDLKKQVLSFYFSSKPMVASKKTLQQRPSP